MRTLLLICCLAQLTKIQAQCGGVYKREAIANYLYPNVYVSDIISAPQDSTGFHISLKEYNTPIFPILKEQIGNGDTYLITELADTNRSHLEVKTGNNTLAIPMGEGIYEGSLTSPLGCITVYSEPGNKKNQLYTYRNDINEVIVSPIQQVRYLGSNDTSLFFWSSTFRLNKVKYFDGTIISIGLNNGKVEEPLLKKKQLSAFRECLFYADPYYILIQHEPRTEYNCTSVSNLSFIVYYNGDVIDTVADAGYNFNRRNVILSNDTLTLPSNDFDTIQMRYGFRYSQYYHGKLILSLSEFELQKQLNKPYEVGGILKIVGNTLITQSQFRAKIDSLPKNGQGKCYSVNGLPIVRDGELPIFMAFDITTGEFLGFPQAQIVE